MEPMLDALTLAPTAQLFELDPPKYTSSYGRRTDAVFKHNVPPAPMLISPDNGLVLYERVISTKAEHRLLDKLTKPKYYHPTANGRKVAERKGLGPTHTGPTAPRPGTAGTRPSSGRGPSAGTSPTRTGDHGGSASGSGAHPHPHTHTHAHAHAHAHANAHPDGPRSRSTSPSGAGSSGVGGAASRGRGVRRKPLYPEEGPLKDYFNKERASVTATTVFTWGNRYKSGTGRIVGGGGAGGAGGGRAGGSGGEASAFPSYSPAQHKPPLRL